MGLREHLQLCSLGAGSERLHFWAVFTQRPHRGRCSSHCVIVSKGHHRAKRTGGKPDTLTCRFLHCKQPLRDFLCIRRCLSPLTRLSASIVTGQSYPAYSPAAPRRISHDRRSNRIRSKYDCQVLAAMSAPWWQGVPWSNGEMVRSCCEKEVKSLGTPSDFSYRTETLHRAEPHSV